MTVQEPTTGNARPHEGQGVGKVGSGAWLGDELDGSFWAS